MKRLICAVLAFSAICSLAGCQKSGGLPQPDFPLTKDVILAAQEQTGLPGVLSESETESLGGVKTSYALRDQTKTNGDTESKTVNVTFVTSAIADRERFLSTFFGTSIVQEKPDFAWEDWKQSLEFTTLLYGGFADAEELYRVFSAMDVAGANVELKGETMPGTECYEWDAQLPGAYCRVRYSLNPARITRSSYTGTLIEAWSCRLSVSLYETEELYRESQKNYMEAYQKEQDRIAAIKEARSEALKETAPWLVD